ncbi:hypothetical protein GARC_2069 [Paraglaciecola arctica BSs20135]|uniref:Uncharacterized protein n=1 Tax=Paraglaciecola arctica BSs20135 TaxID=493475 RepID=K6Y4Z1_9ALTE|nr:hypothetical protein GARC_2069 [Paraglaciecola arctica BSs20135]
MAEKNRFFSSHFMSIDQLVYPFYGVVDVFNCGAQIRI